MLVLWGEFDLRVRTIKENPSFRKKFGSEFARKRLAGEYIKEGCQVLGKPELHDNAIKIVEETLGKGIRPRGLAAAAIYAASVLNSLKISHRKHDVRSIYDFVYTIGRPIPQREIAEVFGIKATTVMHNFKHVKKRSATYRNFMIKIRETEKQSWRQEPLPDPFDYFVGEIRENKGAYEE